VHVARGHANLLRIGPVVGKPEDAELRPLGELVLSPVEARVDHDGLAHQSRAGVATGGDDLARSIRAQDDPPLEARRVRAGAATNPHVAVVQRRRPEADHDLIRGGRGILDLLDREVLGSAGLAQDYRAHGWELCSFMAFVVA
jgi:hypothetical protein